ncbi:complement C5 [Brachionichthys hirsutus]|uniref:complement C5 n=1 Tax=Brachionichthys hirsutus TaxID=412623 RepID=UPI0036049167
MTKALLMCVFFISWRAEADPRSYLITAPLSLRLDAEENVVVQLFGFTDQVDVYVFLRTSMAPNHVVLAKKMVTLNPQNHYQAAAKVRLYTGQLHQSVDHVILHVQSREINQHLSVPVSRANGYLFIQTDKPLYTPHQSVKVRAFSLNQELRPANRSVFLTFKDPDHTTVDSVEMIDVNNGIPSMQNPFRIPLNPKLGIWFIEASYSDEFTTTARTDFEVREYVLPSFSIQVEPQASFIADSSFTGFNFKVSARYLHGAPLANGVVFLRYGYVSGTDPPVLITSSVVRDRLSPDGKIAVTVDMRSVLSRHNGPRDLSSLVGKYLVIAVLVQEDTGGITQELVFDSVKFVKSPYRLSLVSTPPFIKPGLPFNIQVLVKDHLDKPVQGVQVRLVERQVSKKGRDDEVLPCPGSSTSQSDGLAVFICNTPKEAVKAVLKFVTADPALPPTSQASLNLNAVAYYSPNQRYLYIDPPMPGNSLVVGSHSQVSVYSATPSYVPVRALSYLVLSKGKLVHFGSQTFVSRADNRQVVRFQVLPSMVPSVRLLVYYILFGEGTSELVADSVWLDVRHKCVNGLLTHLSRQRRDYKPKENLRLDVRTNHAGLVALSAVDSTIFALRPNYVDPVSTVLRHIEKSDQGCGGGGGKDAADVFHLAGLTFITNANARPSSGSKACSAAVRAKRALSDDDIEKKAASYRGYLRPCCEEGMDFIPRGLTCLQLATQRKRNFHCRRAFRECCEFLQEQLDQNHKLARQAMGANYELMPSLVRSYFPESWMWEVQRTSGGLMPIHRTLPDSLTTWEFKAVGMFGDGICVSDPVRVFVGLPLSLDVPLPYQAVRGEQLVLNGSVYNQQHHDITYCVTLEVGPGVCLLQSQPSNAGAGLRSTACTWKHLPAGEVGKVDLTILGLEPGEHKLIFTLKTRRGQKDILEKKLRVVPEGIRKEQFSGGRLDPQGLHGSEERIVELKNKMPANVVPNTIVERMLTIQGEVLGDFLSVTSNPEVLRQLVNLPGGSAESELSGLLPLVQVYHYLETMSRWDILGEDIEKTSANMKQTIREGLIGISSFRHGDCSYSMWMKRESSTWITALVVKTLSMTDPVVSVNRQQLSESVAWLIRSAQQQDGSFMEKSSFRPNRAMVAGMDTLDQSVYLTSFTLIALHKATRINDPILQLRSQYDSMRSAANYISQHASSLKSVYVRAVAAYALTLHDPDSFAAFSLIDTLERQARQKGNPAKLRYWQETFVTADWLKPDQSSSLTVETTAYVLLSVLIKGRIPYANPILTWLTQDQHYGEGFFSLQETVLTLEAVTEYSKIAPQAVLNQDINIIYRKLGLLGRVELRRNRPVATPIQVTKNDDIIVSTGYGRGVSTVKMKTVYYETVASAETCHFDLTIDVNSGDNPNNANIKPPYLVACAKFKPPPNEGLTESARTVMNIQLATGVEAYLEDLRQFKDGDEPIVSHYSIQGNTVVIQMDAIPSDYFLCVDFRIRTRFSVTGSSKSLFTVYEPQDRGSMCTKQFSYQEQVLQRLCVAEQCQCMTAACATYRGNDTTLTASTRTDEACKPHIKYAYQVSVKSSAAEGDFMIYTATIDKVLKNSDKDFEAVRSGTEVELVKKATCSAVDIQNKNQYMVMGASGSAVTLDHGFKYRLPLDSEAVVELWPSGCRPPGCLKHGEELEIFALDMQLDGCPDPLPTTVTRQN